MYIPRLPNNTDVKVGDLLISSGLGGRFPEGYPVAIVTEIKRDPGQPFAKIIAQASAHLEQSREVLLVMQGEETTPDTKAVQLNQLEQAKDEP